MVRPHLCTQPRAQGCVCGCSCVHGVRLDTAATVTLPGAGRGILLRMRGNPWCPSPALMPGCRGGWYRGAFSRALGPGHTPMQGCLLSRPQVSAEEQSSRPRWWPSQQVGSAAAEPREQWAAWLSRRGFRWGRQGRRGSVSAAPALPRALAAERTTLLQGCGSSSQGYWQGLLHSLLCAGNTSAPPS